MQILAICAVALLVGALYAVVGIRSPAPPFVAMIGLLGMLTASSVLGTLS